MKKIVLSLSLSLLMTFWSCVNNSEEDLFVDCTSSDLKIEVVSFQKSDCDKPGSIEVAASGGKSPYTYSQDGGTFQESATFGSVSAGEFVLIAKDKNGCTASVDFTLESESSGITLSVSAIQSNCSSPTGSINIEATGGEGALSFAIDGKNFSDKKSFASLSSGKYTVSAKDEGGCMVTKEIQVLSNTSLDKDIAPIILSNCAITNCHNGSRSPNLSSKSSMVSSAGSIKSVTQSGSMPKNGTLSQSEIDLIACWVDSGAKNN